jgi:hypothetical protein
MASTTRANKIRMTEAYSYHSNCLWLTLLNDINFRGLSLVDALTVITDLAQLVKEAFVGAQADVRLTALRDIYQAIHQMAKGDWWEAR